MNVIIKMSAMFEWMHNSRSFIMNQLFCILPRTNEEDKRISRVEKYCPAQLSEVILFCHIRLYVCFCCCWYI